MYVTKLKVFNISIVIIIHLYCKTSGRARMHGITILFISLVMLYLM